MDPFSAFSFACNILHAVELGCKVLIGTAERYKAASGMTAEHQKLYQTCVTIDDLNASLAKSLPDPAKPDQLSPSERRLLDASRKCAVLSEDFKLLLGRLETKPNSSVVKTFNLTVKAFWLKDKIDALQKSLSEARDNLTLALLFYMQSQNATASSQTQDQIALASSSVEHAVVQVVKSSSELISTELQRLANELREDSAARKHRNFSSILSEHAVMINEITHRLELLGLSQESIPFSRNVVESDAVCQKLLDRLFFSQMHRRFHQIAGAEYETYKWMLRPQHAQDCPCACFTTWLGSSDHRSGLYCIFGKPGSGKSTLVKFLHRHLVQNSEMRSWCGGQALYIAHHFFWSNGDRVQKSFEGFCRSLLFQLLDQERNLIPKIFPNLRNSNISRNHGQVVEWTNTELCYALRHTVELLLSSGRVLLMVDGLDELVATEEEEDQIIELLHHLRELPGIKIILSSRPWNVFWDEFDHLPQLQLEKLTHDDISLYVTSKLYTHPRWREMCRLYSKETRQLISNLSAKAAGVFLWVKLVVRSVIESLRDGDDLPQLDQKVTKTPAKLEQYFKMIFESIHPDHRREASMLLQVAMHDETRFITVSSFSLLEASFICKPEGFAFAPDPDLARLDFGDLAAMRLRLDGALRRLNSRCKGLLECITDESPFYSEMYQVKLYQNLGSPPGLEALTINGVNTDRSQALESLEIILGLRIDFIHSSLKDFLLKPDLQSLLFDHTSGPFDARDFLCNARLVQAEALLNAADGVPGSTRFASHLITALSKSPPSPQMARLAKALPSYITRLAECYVPDNYSGLYIAPSLEYWGIEGSDFLTLAIDFGLTGYVLDNSTPEVIQRKVGRPFLDYILRPRFTTGGPCSHANCDLMPDLNMVRATISHGANPNEFYKSKGTSIWALFLCFIADWETFKRTKQHYQTSLLQILKALIEAGADLFLPASFLSVFDDYRWMYAGSSLPFLDVSIFGGSILKQRWPDAQAVQIGSEADGEAELYYAVSSLISKFYLSKSEEGQHLIAELQAEERRRMETPGFELIGKIRSSS